MKKLPARGGKEAEMDRESEILQLASDIVNMAKDSLTVNLRFLDTAISRLHYQPSDKVRSITTDGANVFYSPLFIIRSFREEKTKPARLLLHEILHCIFLHFTLGKTVDSALWDLATDIAVENAIDGLHADAVETTEAGRRRKAAEAIAGHVKFMTAEHVYAYLQTEAAEGKREQLAPLFSHDEHGAWYVLPQESAGGTKGSRKGAPAKAQDAPSEQNDRDGQGGKDSPERPDENDRDNADGLDGLPLSGDLDGPGTAGRQDALCAPGDQDTGGGPNLFDGLAGSGGQSDEDGQFPDDWLTQNEALAETWEEVARTVKTDLETFSAKGKGSGAGSGLMQNLKEVTREKYDYTAFLKKFAVMHEVMKVNGDEFDYIFYTYGLRLYDNVPLIEPLEYKDDKRIRDLVIAIDTSGSTCGDLVLKFLQKTYNILKSEEAFHRKFHLHVLQCDAAVQEDAVITSQREFDDYIRHFSLKGCGGTDFRPVFRKVDELVAAGAFRDLKGLIYFTDGCGDYPTQPPEYRAAFVFIEDEYDDRRVPPWAIKLVLRPEEV